MDSAVPLFTPEVPSSWALPECPTPCEPDGPDPGLSARSPEPEQEQAEEASSERPPSQKSP